MGDVFGDAISWLCSEFKDRSDPENVKLKMGHMFHTDKDLFVQGTTEQKTKGGKGVLERAAEHAG